MLLSHTHKKLGPERRKKDYVFIDVGITILFLHCKDLYMDRLICYEQTSGRKTRGKKWSFRCLNEMEPRTRMGSSPLSLSRRTWRIHMHLFNGNVYKEEEDVKSNPRILWRISADAHLIGTDLITLPRVSHWRKFHLATQRRQVTHNPCMSNAFRRCVFFRMLILMPSQLWLLNRTIYTQRPSVELLSPAWYWQQKSEATRFCIFYQHICY